MEVDALSHPRGFMQTLSLSYGSEPARTSGPQHEGEQASHRGNLPDPEEKRPLQQLDAQGGNVAGHINT